MYNQLPFRTDMIERPQMIFNLDNPPVMFNLRVSPELQSVTPAIISLLANDLTNQASVSAIRCFTYNQMSFNNWNNNEFMEACQFAAGLAQLKLYKRAANNIEHAVNESCMAASAAYTSININNFPLLRQYVPVEMVHMAAQNIQEFSGTMNEINNMFNNLGGGRTQMNNQYPPIQSSSNYQAQVARPFNGGNSNSSFAVGMGVSMTNSGMVNNSVTSDRYAERNNNIAKSQPTITAVQVAPQVYQEQNKPLTKKDWKTTAVQPYRTLFNTSIYLAVYNEQYINGIKVIMETITEKELEMDRSNHIVGALPGSYDGLDKTRNISELDLPPVVNKAINVAVATSEIADANTVITTDVWMQETSLDDAIFTARKWLFKTGEKALFTCNAYIATPYLRSKYLDKLFEALTYSVTFAEIAQHLNTAMKADIPEAFTLNKLMTECVNDILRNRMSLETSIDSFAGDLNELVPYIAKKYGGLWINAWEIIEAETLVAKALFAPENETIVDGFTSILAESEDSTDNSVKANDIHLHIRRYSISLIDVLSKDLNYNLTNKEALLISPTISPSLFRLAEHLFDVGNSVGIQIHVLVTQDNVKYQISKGSMVKNSYLISLL